MTAYKEDMIMPGFTTHYLFGQNTYKQLKKNSLKKIIQANHAAYHLGLQGPDLFFYYLPSYTIHANNIGSVAHTEDTGKFLFYLLRSRQLFADHRQQQIAEAYIAGFLGHYTLDTHCHPYVYWKTDFQEKNNCYHGRHMGLEVDIDTELLQFYKHCLPSAFRQDTTIHLTHLQVRTIAAILHFVYRKTYPELGILYPTMYISIRSIQLGTKWLWDPSGRKKRLLGRLERLILGYPLLSTLIPSDTEHLYLDPLNILHRPWHNPWDLSQTSNDSFFDLMEKAQISYLELLSDFNQLIRQSPAHAKTPTKAFLRKLGNRSYHSGLDSRIPS